MRLSLIPLGAVLVLTAVSLTAAPANASPVVVHCGDTISVDTALANSLTCATGPALTIAAGIILDLHHHTIRGPGDDSQAGILITTEDKVTITNGTITAWRTGIGPGDIETISVALRGITATHSTDALDGFNSTFDVRSSSFANNGIGVNGFYGFLTIDRSTFTSNSVAAISSTSAGSVRISRSYVAHNTIGIGCSETGVYIDRSTFVGNGTAAGGWYCGGSVTRSTFSANNIAYEMLSPVPSPTSFDFVLSHNRFIRNALAVHFTNGSASISRSYFSRNHAALVAAEADGAHLRLTGSIFVHNYDAVNITAGPAAIGTTTALYNHHYGIYAPDETTDLGGNVARGNGFSPQCTGVVCTAH